MAPGNDSGAAKAAASDKPGTPMLGDAPATSPAAAEAKAVAERYFDLIEKKKYRDAWLLWGNGGADSKGTATQFADSFKPFSVYEPTVGEPTEIKARDGQQFIAVAASAHVKIRKTGKEQERSGVVMLRRSADPSETIDEKKNWRIWGVDLRVRH
ncbi:MAG: hypothetical protein B7Y45_03725 [Sphingomonas sp. 28-66-16]|nr:MAG: hypothetical protein B7Y45_03725 [Sphingomonas sp. 28-66-16]